MNGVTAVEGIDYVDCDEDFEERYEDIIGVTWLSEEKVTPIVIAVKNSYTGYVDTKPIHGSQVKFPAEKQKELHDTYGAFGGYTFYGLNLKPNRELYNAIYRNGESVILISPTTIRKKMIQELTSSIEMLNSIRETD